jgi:hypothetical protein
MTQTMIPIPAQQVGSYGYTMEFPVMGVAAESTAWRVLITRPNGTSVERTSAAGDVIAVDPAKENDLMGVKIKAGDFPVAGTYSLQLFDETVAGSSLAYRVALFAVLDSLTPPVVVP